MMHQVIAHSNGKYSIQKTKRQHESTPERSDELKAKIRPSPARRGSMSQAVKLSPSKRSGRSTPDQKVIVEVNRLQSSIK